MQIVGEDRAQPLRVEESKGESKATQKWKDLQFKR